MSETETGKAISLPPQGEFFPNDRGLTAWSPKYTTIGVDILRDDKVGVQIVHDGVIILNTTLNQTAAQHLASLLTKGATK